MKNILIALLAVLMCVPAFAQHKIVSNEIPDFTSVSVQGNIVMDIVAAEKAVLTVEISDADDPTRFSWSVKDKCLYIKLKRGIRQTPSATVRLATPKLDRLSVVDATVNMPRFNSKIFDVEASASANLVLNIGSSDIAVRSSNSAIVRLSGTTKYLSVVAAGDSMVNAIDLKATSVDVSTSFVAEALVNVSERLVAKAELNSMVRYVGDPVIARLKTSARGEIFKVD